MHPGKFNVIFNRDPGTTGNLEVLIYVTSNHDTKKTVHTKRGSQGYPSSNWQAFHTRLDKAIEELH